MFSEGLTMKRHLECMAALLTENLDNDFSPYIVHIYLFNQCVDTSCGIPQPLSKLLISKPTLVAREHILLADLVLASNGLNTFRSCSGLT